MQLQTAKITAYKLNQQKTIKIGDTTYPRTDVIDNNGHIKEDIWIEIVTKLRPNDNNYRRAKKNSYINAYHAFKQAYPLLNDWLNEDVSIRVGKKDGDNKEITNYNARLYILCHVACGLKLDYPYILSVVPIYEFNYVCDLFDLKLAIPEVLDIQKTLTEYKNTKLNKHIITIALSSLFMHAHRNYRKLTANDLITLNDACKKHIPKTKQLSERYNTGLARVEYLLLSEKIITSKVLGKNVTANLSSKNDPMERLIEKINQIKMREVVAKYYADYRHRYRQTTKQMKLTYIVEFCKWLEKEFPHIDTFELLTKAIGDKYIDYLSSKGNKVRSVNGAVYALHVFFDTIEEEEYPNIPLQRVISVAKLAKPPKTEPRFIPAEELKLIMDIVYAHNDPYFRNMAIILRWEGLRIDELLRLDMHALHYDKDNKPWLRVPPSKTNNYRNIPMSRAAESAFNNLLQLRTTARNTIGLPDRITGQLTHYLLMVDNQQFSYDYVNEQLREICSKLQFLKPDGEAKYTSHCFRHTIATEMLNAGAGIKSIMDFLGHESFQMVLTYAHMFSKTVQEDYYKTVDSIEESGKSLGTNDTPIYKININVDKVYTTSLGVGKCYHHPKEKMCEIAYKCWDCNSNRLCLTQDDLPALEKQYVMEQHLVQLSREKEWSTEVERHSKVAEKIKYHIQNLGGTV